MGQVKVRESESAGSGFVYVDDFCYWLSCKFVTCDKRKEAPAAKSTKASPKAPHKAHPKASPAASEAHHKVADDDADSEEDKREMEEAEKSMKAKNLQEVSKISKQYDHKKNSTGGQAQTGSGKPRQEHPKNLS